MLELFLGQIAAETALDLIQSALGDDVLHGHHREIRRAKLHGGRCKQHAAGVPVAILTQLLIGLHIVAQKAHVYLRVQMIQAVHEQLAHLCSDVAAALAHKQDHILFAGFFQDLIANLRSILGIFQNLCQRHPVQNMATHRKCHRRGNIVDDPEADIRQVVQKLGDVFQ